VVRLRESRSIGKHLAFEARFGAHGIIIAGLDAVGISKIKLAER
jgi:hypothetical protein